MIDWTKLPDIVAFFLLACAFASVLRRHRTSGVDLWLVGWILILLHFVALMLAPLPQPWGTAADICGVVALVSAGVLFMWSQFPYRETLSSRIMLGVGIVTLSGYLVAADYFADRHDTVLDIAAILIGYLPLLVYFAFRRDHQHPLRVISVVTGMALCLYLLAVQHGTPYGIEIASDSILFAIFASCALHVWWNHPRMTAGTLITVSGFLAWSAVFPISLLLRIHAPQLHVEEEIWNLPKYVVAAGMILLLLEQQIAHSEYMALHDDLTGLPNRRLFHDRLASALSRAQRAGTQFALLLIDLDHFKEVNDTLGHPVGDALLQRVTEIFNTRLRRSDTLARTGGDEFSLILEEPLTLPDAENVALALIRMLEAPIEVRGRQLKVSASIGLAMYPDDARDAETLTIAADRRMYTAKHLGRGRYSASLEEPAST
jgi:diguanylate cyclase (GGDEF)-like protein